MRRGFFQIVAQLLLLQLFYRHTNGAIVAVGSPARDHGVSAHTLLLANGHPPLQVLEQAANHTRGEEDNERKACRSLSPPRNETPLPVFVGRESVLDLAETLTSVVSNFIPGMGIVNDVLHVFKILTSFFSSQVTTTVHADYWNLLKNEVEFMVESTIDQSVLSATGNAVSRMKDSMEIYLNNSEPMKTWSTLILTLQMDTILNDILSDYYGVIHRERAFLPYLDMATTRITLWQTTTLRYIQELGLYGQGASNSVCDIVLMWQRVFESETERIEKDLKPSMDTWRKNWKSKMQLVCHEKCDDYWGWGWNKHIDCYVRDGYNGQNYPTESYSCTHKTCWSDVCNQFCSKKVSEKQAHVDPIFNRMMTVPDTFKKNMDQVASSKMYDYVRGCLVTTTDPDEPDYAEDPGSSGRKVNGSLGALLVSLLVVLGLGLRLPLLQ